MKCSNCNKNVKEKDIENCLCKRCYKEIHSESKVWIMTLGIIIFIIIGFILFERFIIPFIMGICVGFLMKMIVEQRMEELNRK